MSIPHNRHCIVCGRAIAKRTQEVRVQPTSFNHTANFMTAQVQADLHSIEDCRRYTNAPYIISTRRRQGLITAFSTWDGESYRDKFFCTNRCAMDQGYASAHHGARFVWKR